MGMTKKQDARIMANIYGKRLTQNFRSTYGLTCYHKDMKKLFLVSVLFVLLITPITVGGTELDDQLTETQQKLETARLQKEKARQELDYLESLKAQYQSSLNNLQYNFSVTQSQLSVTTDTLNTKLAEIEETEKELAEIEKRLAIQEKNLSQVIRTNYMLSGFITAPTFLRSSQEHGPEIYMYKRAIANHTKKQLIDLSDQRETALEIKDLLASIKAELETEKSALEQQQQYLASSINTTKIDLDNAKNQSVNTQQSLAGIDQQISSLTAIQQQILAAKAAAALKSTTVGDVAIDGNAIDKAAPKDGNVYFSFWTYGWPHRVGMNQYGAFGRAKAGQSVDQILTTYYANTSIVDWTVPDTITLTSGATIPFEEDYLMGIGEMPSCWGNPSNGGLEALKAQAIAARTYALAYTNNGALPICTTQACQVYVGASKTAGSCGEYWRQAVNETKGRVIVSGGQPITAYYASTAGGFTLSSQEVWGGNRSYAQRVADFDANGNAYDGPAHGDSPWYHKAWGNDPWLSVAQVTDIMNGALLPDSYNTIINSISGDEIIAALKENNLTYIENLTALEIIDENGNTGANTATVSQVRAYFNDGSIVSVTGNRFKFVFNLRSPGTDGIFTTRFDVITAAEL